MKANQLKENKGNRRTVPLRERAVRADKFEFEMQTFEESNDNTFRKLCNKLLLYTTPKIMTDKDFLW